MIGLRLETDLILIENNYHHHPRHLVTRIIAMPIPNHVTFAETIIGLDHTAYSPQWSKSSTCDRLINAIYAESLASTTSQATIDNRYAALLEYMTVKGQMVMVAYAGLSAARRMEMHNLTLTNALISNGDAPIGRSGRFHRAVMVTMHEATALPPPRSKKKLAYFNWCNSTIQGIAAALGESAPPTFIPPVE
jgi:hypothetical protein